MGAAYVKQNNVRTTVHRFAIWNVVLVYEQLSQSKLCSEDDVSSLDLFDVSLLQMFLPMPNRTVDENTIEVLETEIPVTPTAKRCRKRTGRTAFLNITRYNDKKC